MMGTGRIALAQIALIAAGLLSAAPELTAAERRTIGTARVAGNVESMVRPGTWRPMTGGAVVEGMGIRTGAKDTGAVLELANGDMIGLAESSEVTIAPGRPLAVRVLAGRVAYRLRAGSTTVLETTRGSVRAPAVRQVSSGNPVREGVVAYGDDTMTVQGYRGVTEIVAPNGHAATVAAGQIGTLAPLADAPKVQLAAATAHPPQAPAKAAKPAGGFDWFPSFLGLS